MSTSSCLQHDSHLSGATLLKTPDLLPSHYQELPSEDSGRHSDPRRRKIFRKITLALVSIVLLGLLVRDLTFVQKQYSAYMGGAKRWDWPIPSDLTVKECPELIPSDLREIGKASIHFALPVSSKSLFLISRGFYSVGGVYFSQSDEISDDVKVEIDIEYNENHDDLDLVKVCSVSKRDGQNGVGIFTPPRHIDRRRQVHLNFKVHVIFPKSSSGALRIPNLDVEMPVFSQHIGDLSSVVFDYFGIKTAVGSIQSESLTAHIAKLSDANGAITGHFNTSTYLELETANGVIDVSVDVYNLDEEKASGVRMKTANAAIAGALSLKSVNTTGGSFYVSAQTSVGSVKLDFPEAPVGSALSVQAETAMGHVDVGLHETFEGRFGLKTVMGQTVLDYNPETEKERGREVHVSRVGGGQLTGNVSRNEAGKTRGEVRLQTSMALVKLRL